MARSKVTIFPKKSIWQQFNQGELFGDIFGSFNLDLISNKGKVRVSPAQQAIITSNDDANMKYPIGAKKSSALNGSTYKWWILCNTKLFVDGNPGGPFNFAADATANTPTCSHLVSDIEDFAGDLYVSNSTDDIARLHSGTWTASWWKTTLGQTGLSTPTPTIPHVLHVAFNNLLLIGDGNKLHTVDTSNNVDTGGSGGARLTFKSELNIVWIRSSKTTIWIGLRNVRNGSAEVVQWDGASTNFNNNYKLNSSECYAGIIKDDIPYIVIGTGELQQFNGRGFVTIDNFPIFMNKDHYWQDDWTIPVLVHRNGMAVVNGNINILASGSFDGGRNVLENMPAGIWEYTRETGLYHKFAITKNKSSDTNTEYGSPTMEKPGFLVSIPGIVGGYLAGAGLITADSSVQSEISSVVQVVNEVSTNTIKKMGYLITPQIHTSQIEEVWQTFWLLAKKFVNSTANIEVKYRLDKFSFNSANNFDFNQESGPVWASTTTFTINTSTYPDAASIAVGDEIQITLGVGAGLCANIITVSAPVANVVTFTIDKTVTGASNQKIGIKVSRWVKINNWQDQVQRYKQNNINQTSSFIQFKLVLFGLNESPELEKIKLRSQAKRLI